MLQRALVGASCARRSDQKCKIRDGEQQSLAGIEHDDLRLQCEEVGGFVAQLFKRPPYLAQQNETLAGPRERGALSVWCGRGIRIVFLVREEETVGGHGKVMRRRLRFA